MLAPVRITAPDAAPVTLAEAKAHCRVDHNDDDTLIGALIASATQYFDGYTGIVGRALVTQSWEQRFAGFGCLRLLVGPVTSVTSVTYFDGNNEEQTLADTVYQLFTDARGPYLDLQPDQSWPSIYARRDAVSVKYVAGDEVAEVPAPLKSAILLMVGHLYEHREAVTDVSLGAAPLAVDALIAPYRRVGL
ncbi:Phage gp6-like head-tail connector protein [Methyloligella halotolerans]|uniref:Phage gp6-like head-tail connector protein n=1 Tax=Methyloligella halotolerans TaxID=1177755 RepID=A0A1E2S036_9HYPH|nr:head-tail connector protein [Methyloligella halotolerans]ODA67669.1 Phage gp6-like head-tail connector protein [Methyloligella halotolerans]